MIIKILLAIVSAILGWSAVNVFCLFIPPEGGIALYIILRTSTICMVIATVVAIIPYFMMADRHRLLRNPLFMGPIAALTGAILAPIILLFLPNSSPDFISFLAIGGAVYGFVTALFASIIMFVRFTYLNAPA